MINTLKEGASGIYFAGERSQVERARRSLDGVPVVNSTVETLNALGSAIDRSL